MPPKVRSMPGALSQAYQRYVKEAKAWQDRDKATVNDALDRV
ncbi:hypothetical protein [Paenibacillus sp. SYP-B4298]|nr:hypothetical protein [Paenibacillus sp. SYP-B4298]